MDFDSAFQDIMNVEKGYWNDPVGGPTMYGVTERVARANRYYGDMRLLPLSTASAIAKSEYWDRFKCDLMPYPIAYQVFDTAYNGGKPIQWLQEAVGVAADGIIGPVTLAAVKAADTGRVVASFNASRIRYLTSLKNWAANSRGWALRIAANLERDF